MCKDTNNGFPEFEFKKPFGSIQETADETGISEYQLRVMLKQGKLPGFNVGKKYMVDKPALMKVIRSNSSYDVGI